LCTKTSRGTRCQGRTRRRVAAGWAARRRPIGGGGHGDLLENREAAAQTRAEHTTESRQSTRSCRASGRPRPHGVVRSRAPNPRSWPCGGCRPCGWISGLDAGGWPAPAAAVARCRCPLLHQPRSHRGWRRPFPRHMDKVGVDADTGEVSRRDALGASFTRVTPSQPDESWLPRPPAAWRPEGLPVGAC
jgi:hypothetical protein